MKDPSKTNQHLIKKISALKQRIQELEQSESDHEQAQAALQKSEAKYRSIFDNAVEGIFQTTPEGQFLIVNSALAEMFGYDSPEELTSSVTNIGNQLYADQGQRLEHLRILSKKRVVENFEGRMYRKDGSIFWVSLDTRLLSDQAGKPLWYEGFIVDITERKRVEKALEKSEERFRAIAIYTYDWENWVGPDGKLIWVNPAVQDFTGYSVNECLDMSDFPFPIIHEAHRERMRQFLSVAIQGTAGRDIEFLVCCKDGSIKWASVSWQSIYDDKGNFIGHRSSVSDITERKQMEKRLKQSEERYRSLSEASLEAIVFIEDSFIVDANEALNHLFGYEGDDLRGRPATDFIVPERRAFTDERMRTRTEGTYETLGLRKNGSVFPIEVNPREFKHDGRKLRISAVRDLTERKEIEKRFEAYQENLERLVEERTNELKKSEEKFRNIFENAHEGIFQSTPDGRLISANPVFANMFGSETPEELIELITDIPEQLYADPAKRLELVDILTHAGAVQDFEFQVRRRDNVIKHASMNARAVKDERGEILFFEGTIQDITEKKEAGKALEVERQSLEEANTALKVLLKHREDDRKELEEKLLANVKHLVMPYVEKLKKSALDPVQHMSISFIESNLNEIMSPFLHSIQGFKFTPRQLEVVTLIREGRTTKDIASLLNMNKEAVDIQRYLIRKKLGLNKSKTNLQSYLLSLG